MITPGSRVDVVVTREGQDGGPGRTRLALQDVEVLAASPADQDGGGGSSGGAQSDAAPRVAVSLRVTLRQAVYLAAAQSFAREVRLLPRSPADRGRSAEALGYDATLG